MNGGCQYKNSSIWGYGKMVAPLEERERGWIETVPIKHFFQTTVRSQAFETNMNLDAANAYNAYCTMVLH